MAICLASTACNQDLKKDKLEQAILFFIRHAKNEHLGKTKLMKLLYYADFDHYEQYEQSITGARYRRLDHGPVPDDAKSALEEMKQAGRLRVERVSVGDYARVRFETDERVNLEVFSQIEIDTLHQVAQRWLLHTTKQIEAATHGEAPWLAVKRNEIIPYYLAHYRNNFGAMDLDDEDVADPERLPDEDEVFAL